MRTIGHVICDSGLDDMWTAADVYGTTVVNQIINCSHMKRSLAAHELNMIVLYTLYLQALEKEDPNMLSMADLLNMIVLYTLYLQALEKEDPNMLSMADLLNMIVLYTLYLQALEKEDPNMLSMGD